MAEEFTAITTQEQLNEVIKDRLARQKEQFETKYADYEELKTKNAGYEKQLGELNTSLEESGRKVTELETQIADRDSKIKAHETRSVKTRIAHEMGLGYEAIDFLQGEDEDAIKKSAESLKTLVGKSHTAPLANHDNFDSGSGAKASVKKLAKSLGKTE